MRLVPERPLREFAFREKICRGAQACGNSRQLLRGVDVADEALRRLDLVGDAIQARGQRSRERKVGIAVGAGDAALDTQALAFADDTEAGRAVVVAPGEA